MLRRAYLASVLQDHEEHYSEQSLSEIYYQLAFIDYSMKSYQKARDNIECSLVLNESNYKSYNLDALVYFAEGNIPKAIKQVASSININNGYAYSHYNMGVIWESQNKHAKAANAYIKCLILEPEFYEALFNLSNILLDLNCYEDAGIIASYGATISPAFEAEICSNIAISLLNSGHSQQGLKILLGLASHNNAQYIFYNIAFTYYSRGQLETAQDWLDKINSEKISPELSISVIQLRKNIKQNKIEHFDISEETPNTAKKLGIKIDFLYSYLEENGFRRNIKFEKIVHHATHSQPISPLKFCPKSSQQQTKKSKNSKRQLNNAPKREPALPLTQSKVPKVKRIKRKNNLRHHRLPSYSGG